MDTEGLSLICSGLVTHDVDDQGNQIGYSKHQYGLDNLKDLLRFLRRDDPQTRDVFKQVCKWNSVSNDVIPIIEYLHEDRNLLLNAVKVLVFLTMPIEPGSTDVSQQLEYLWGLKSAVTNSDVVPVIVSILEKPLENLELGAFTEDDWKLVQLVLTLFRNILAIQEIPSHQKSGGFASQFLSLRDRFLELLFRENVMDIILVISQNVGGSNAYLRQDNLLLLEIFHYIFMGQEPELIARGHSNGLKVNEDSQASLESLQSIIEEEKKKKIICRFGNISRHSQFSGTFARFTMDGSKAVLKGNPNSSRKSQNVTRGPAKKIAWDHPRLPSTKDKLLELLQGFVNQFLSGGYNILMRSIRQGIEKEHPAIQKSDIVVFFQVAEFVTSFQFYKYSASKTKEGRDPNEIFGDKDADTSDSSGEICGPIEASLNESMFQLVISKWRHAYDGLKETNDYKFLSAAGSLLKNMIRMLDLVLKLLPEDSKEPQTARILLYKLFYDQTEEGMTHFVLNLIRAFDAHKQCKSDLADLVEIIYKVVKLMDYLQSRGTLRVSKKSRKSRKKKLSAGTENKQTGDPSCIQDEAGISIDNQLAENQSLPESLPKANSTGEEDVPDIVPDEHENIEENVNSQVGLEPNENINPEHPNENIEENVNSQVGLEPMENTNPGHPNEDTLDGTGDSSEDEQLNPISEVDFSVSTLVSAFANHSIIQKLCWLLKFYKSNSLAINHYIISMLRRISDDLELHPMLYQLSLLTTFNDILVEQKSCPCKEYADIVDFLTSLVRKMLKKMKKQPLLFVEVLFWKTRRECHYINAEYLLDELGHLRKESMNWNDTQGDREIGSSAVKKQSRRSIADALGDDEADVVISHNNGYHNYEEKLDDVVESFASTSGNKNRRDDSNREKLMEDELRAAPRRKKKLILDAELERQIRDLYEKFKDDRNCSRCIAEMLDPDGKISPAQISSKLKKLGLTIAPRKKVDADAETLSTSPNQLESDGVEGVANHKSVNLDRSLLVQHQQTRKRVRAFNEDQEALIKDLYEQFKDHRKCSYMIANALDADEKFTPAQISRKLKQLGLAVPQKSFKRKVHPKGEDLMDCSKDRTDESDDEALISLLKRKKVESRKESSKHIHEQTGGDELSKDDSDDEIFSSILKKKTKNSTVSGQQIHEVHEHNNEDELSKDDSDDEILSSILKKKTKNSTVSGQQIHEVHEHNNEDELSKDDSDDEILRSILKKKTKNSTVSNQQIHEVHEHNNEDELSKDDSDDEMLQSAPNENQVAFVNSHQAEYQQLDPDLVDSEDDVAVNAIRDNAVSRRKLRMVIDPEDDD